MLDFSLTKFINKRYHPSKRLLLEIIRKSLLHKYIHVFIEIKIVTDEESRLLNLEYRNIDKPTNVIALEYPDTRDNFGILNGEIILCDNIIVKESIDQDKVIKHHYIHMIVHALLHLQGLDHLQEHDRVLMEKKEIAILHELQIANPYHIQ